MMNNSLLLFQFFFGEVATVNGSPAAPRPTRSSGSTETAAAASASHPRGTTPLLATINNPVHVFQQNIRPNVSHCFIRLLGVVWNVLAYPFATDGDIKWATGILSVDDDFETFHNANACIVCTLPYVTAKMVTDINDGFNVCSIPQEQISRFTESQCGCTFKEVAVCFNVMYVCLCPCTLCFWRSRLRTAKRLEGSCFGDIFSMICCCPCSVCQQTREIKLRGAR